MRAIGTVLPTRESLAANDAYAASVAAKAERIGREKLADCERRMVGGETRWYAAHDRYAVVSAGGKVRWFEVRADGEYAIKSR